MDKMDAFRIGILLNRIGNRVPKKDTDDVKKMIDEIEEIVERNVKAE